MDYSYSTKEMCDIFGVGRETLRHYENLGLLHPQVNEENGYHVYGYWDVAAMVDVLKYRSNEFTLKDARYAMEHMEFGEIVGALHQQKQYYREQILHYQMLHKKLSMDCEYLQCCRAPFGELVEIRGNSLYFIPYYPLLENKNYEVLQKIFNYSQFFSTAWLSYENEKESDPRRTIGFVTEKEFADYLGMTDGFYLTGTGGVGTVLDVAGQVKVGPDAFVDFRRKAAARYDNLDKENFGILMSRFRDEDGVLHQYVFSFIKFQSEES